ncbi:glycosyltransferase family 4 protein [Spongiivirga citrea]|uniref:Glycosyltransferase n=1 Tax=Spongiivirga citrea TaxID=1481457 RepID=A0A6M0CM20_9FLAO|nr:glycosyltransferase family 4 protein [Spongiivirga citrea]NER16879.1 glycosyltransferase [Spongiivirga citrea]
MKKIIRITTVPISMSGLLTGQLEYMSDHYEMIAVSSDKEKLERYANEINVRSYAIPLTRKITPFTDLKAVYTLYKILKKEKPFIVHSHTPKAGTIGMLAAWLARVPNRLHTIAGLPLLVVTGPKRTLLNIVERVTYWCATKVYPNSHGLMEIVKKLRFAKERKLKVIGNGSSNGIDTSFFDKSIYSDEELNKLKSELKIGQNDKVFVFLGRLVADKGLNEMVAAFDHLNRNSDEAKLLLVGSHERELDPLLPETDRSIEGNDNIILVDWQDDVRPYLAISNFLVFPSYREGFPNTVMQAGAMELPSIVTNINGCNEIIEHKKNGLVIPVKDTAALIEAMSFMVNKIQEVEEMKANARVMITNRYERKGVWQQILTEYQNLEIT